MENLFKIQFFGLKWRRKSTRGIWNEKASWQRTWAWVKKKWEIWKAMWQAKLNLPLSFSLAFSTRSSFLLYPFLFLLLLAKKKLQPTVLKMATHASNMTHNPHWCGEERGCMCILVIETSSAISLIV